MLYLYNKMLQQRQSFVRRQQKRIARRARQHPGLVSGDGDAGWDRNRGAGAGGFTVSPNLGLSPPCHGVAAHGPAAGDVAAGAVLPALAVPAPLGAPELHGVRGARDPPRPRLPRARLRCLVLRAVLEGGGQRVPRLRPRGLQPLPGQQRGGWGLRGLRAPRQ